MHDETPVDPDGVPIPRGGALGLMALGYRGIEAWREARGTDWVALRRSEWEVGRARQAARLAAAREERGESGGNGGGAP